MSIKVCKLLKLALTTFSAWMNRWLFSLLLKNDHYFFKVQNNVILGQHHQLLSPSPHTKITRIFTETVTVYITEGQQPDSFLQLLKFDIGNTH